MKIKTSELQGAALDWPHSWKDVTKKTMADLPGEAA